MATVELAVALPAAVLASALMAGVVRLGVDQLRCADAAAAAARVVARGEPPAAGTAAAQARAPSGALTSIEVTSSAVRVRVMGARPALLGWLPGDFIPQATVTAAREVIAP